ncbi:hypothetical protein DPSP01_005387 [Paraphaeosphaeria sporulosa]|uniref:MARVEL domain-containing protein n=1 Tax=Paraphaeosphaeria sporulosa TaxID=1460663 RepID=A0A177CCY0_9PLEO|nr:uncharacterized protein CC84DRAFT_1122228 [Paraphaeosphaeria sporulosa]OAG05176.1 hypothetical protein CC84DRAFT_1122228 [Paraphaeosphaeria sporulosa]
MALGGAALKLFQTILYAIEFCCAAIILGIYSYFLATLADRDLTIYTWAKAVEGMSGAAVLYTIFAVLLTCFLGGKSFFALIAILLDLAFCGAFIAIAVLTRDGAHSCSGFVRTPLGDGQSNDKQGFDDSNGKQQYTYAVSLGTACRLNTACFAVAIAGALLFLISALVQIALARHHKKEKRFGPSPANNYTSGRGRGGFFGRRKNKTTGLRDPEVAAGTGTLAAGPAHDVRPSHDTAYTGSTVAGAGPYEHNKPLTGGYHTAPVTYPNHTPAPATNY